MKKILTILILFIALGILTACQDKDPEDSENWKIQYDIVDTSPLYKNEVNVCYNIFPISYADSSGDGYGDLNGIAENMDYFTEVLMIDCIWLNPIHPSETYHKYDVLDYYGIDPQFGTMSDFENLIDVADNAGVQIILDLVINHTGYNHPWFINARSGVDSEYRDWYVWNDLTDREAFPNRQGWYPYGDMYYYASFWSRMPELNFDHQPVREEMKLIAEFWLDKGVSGFRIDAARHIYDRNEYPLGTSVNRENLDLFRELNYHIKSINPDAIILGEIWSDNETYVAGFYEGMDATFNFVLAEEIIETINTGTDTGIVDELLTIQDAYLAVREDYIDSIFLTNHDQNRIMNQMNFNEDKARLAAAMLFTLPGISWIYYGEELGMSGSKPDEAIRQPFKWGFDSPYNTEGKPNGIQNWNAYNNELEGVVEQQADAESMLQHYIELMTLKQTQEALRSGEIAEVITSHNGIVSFIRHHDNQTVLVIHNLKNSPMTLNHDLSAYNTLYHSHDDTIEKNTVTVSAYATIVIEINTTNVTLD